MLNPLAAGASSLLKMGGALPATLTSVASESLNSMKGVVDKLSSSLMSGGHLNTDSPLGKMVEQQLKKENPFMALAGGKGGEENAVKKALGDLIKDKLGSNFGASADAGIGGKGQGQGGQDLMSKTLQGLGKSSLDNALTDKGEGSTFSQADKPILQQVANFMDQNKAEFGAPDSGSWSKELDEGGGKDNFLDKGETSKFRAALEQISQQMGAGGAQGSQASQGNGGLGSPQQEPSANDASSGGQSNDLSQLLGSSNPMDIFKQGLEMGLGMAGGKGAEGGADSLAQNGLSPQLQQHSLKSSAAEAAQNILDVMSAGVS
ncbi:hypothetical protein FQ192_12405 [Pseudomonas sp. ANT_J12]|jgi:hypothetical protein|uniref:hypothetical protein n=1 Tax=Pseudomonas sp. ANT_J12 TaxID=2597351 RepID=UPI0011F262E5|nr:hypothetical protein [Pseudomonas sp. ANT_J12]KAA0994907.1 hypothetical protein FQ192_12405 [Pseudomonas sp. ANT_J12]